MSSKYLADRVVDLTPSATVTLPDRARALRKQGIDVLDLSEGQPYFDTPAPIKNSAKQALDEGMVFYIESSGLPELLEQIKAKLERDNGIDVPTSQILPTVGAKQGIFAAILCTINPGDEVLIPDPYWGSHVSCVRLAGGIPVSVPLRVDRGFDLDVEAIREAVTPKTKMIILSSPHNPTGMVATKDDLEGVAEICKRNSILAMSDEIYEKIVYDDAKHYSIGSFAGMEDLAITVNGFSKPYSMTGWRLGYVVANKDIMSRMLIVQQHSVTHPAAFVEKAGVVALRDCGKYVEDMVKHYHKARDYFVGELDKLSLFSCEKPKGAFYAFPKIKNNSKKSADLVEFLLEEAQVLAVPGSSFGRWGEGHMRFVYAQTMDTLRETIERIKAVA
ncbi:MAG: pyridoxal phosphate-dependent aminotransferase [archaeon]